VMVRQGRMPMKWLIDPQAVATVLAHPNKVPLCYFSQGNELLNPDPGPDGFYDLRGVHRDLLEYAKQNGSGTK
jgi:hypothetical protein